MSPRDCRLIGVEIHVTNGVEPGPTPRVDLDAGGQAFDGWTVHVELWSGAS